MATKSEDVLHRAHDEGVRFIRLQFCDILGIPKNVEIPVEKLEETLDKGIAFDGSSIEGFVRISESDMYLRPDPETFVIYPWTGGPPNGNKPQSQPSFRTARLICDLLRPDGQPFEGDPRFALKQVCARAAEAGYRMSVGPEPEFFLLRRASDDQPTLDIHDQGSYFDLMPIDRGEATRQEIVVALEQMGFEVEAAHHEVAPSQHEIDFRYSEAVAAADKILTFKLVTKTIALAHGLHATFMPKPIAGINGSGMHCHLSLFKGEDNAFYDPKAEYGLSKIARWFVGGTIAHVHAIAALSNPLVNSYKRLVPGYEAPVNICWARINRSALIRVPASNTPERSTRIELRCPDPAANPYLLFAAILAAGLDGIRKRQEPPAPVEENIYELSEGERRERAIGTLPPNLESALAALKADEVIRDALGPHIFERYTFAKERELEEYCTAVSSWEVERYSRLY